jgi:hypothetical protein
LLTAPRYWLATFPLKGGRTDLHQRRGKSPTPAIGSDVGAGLPLLPLREKVARRYRHADLRGSSRLFVGDTGWTDEGFTAARSDERVTRADIGRVGWSAGRN